MSDLMDLTPQIDTITTYLKDPRLVEKKDEEGNSYWEPSQEPLEHDGHPMWVERLLPHTEDYKKAQFSRSAKYINQAQGEGTTQDLTSMVLTKIRLVSWQKPLLVGKSTWVVSGSSSLLRRLKRSMLGLTSSNNNSKRLRITRRFLPRVSVRPPRMG